MPSRGAGAAPRPFSARRWGWRVPPRLPGPAPPRSSQPRAASRRGRPPRPGRRVHRAPAPEARRRDPGALLVPMGVGILVHHRAVRAGSRVCWWVWVLRRRVRALGPSGQGHPPVQGVGDGPVLVVTEPGCAAQQEVLRVGRAGPGIFATVAPPRYRPSYTTS